MQFASQWAGVSADKQESPLELNTALALGSASLHGGEEHLCT